MEKMLWLRYLSNYKIITYNMKIVLPKIQKFAREICAQPPVDMDDYEFMFDA